MEIPGNDFRIKNKTIQGRVKVGEKTPVAKSEGTTPAAGSEQIKISSRARDVQLANEVIIIVHVAFSTTNEVCCGTQEWHALALAITLVWFDEPLKGDSDELISVLI